MTDGLTTYIESFSIIMMPTHGQCFSLVVWLAGFYLQSIVIFQRILWKVSLILTLSITPHVVSSSKLFDSILDEILIVST